MMGKRRRHRARIHRYGGGIGPKENINQRWNRRLPMPMPMDCLYCLHHTRSDTCMHGIESIEESSNAERRNKQTHRLALSRGNTNKPNTAVRRAPIHYQPWWWAAATTAPRRHRTHNSVSRNSCVPNTPGRTGHTYHRTNANIFTIYTDRYMYEYMPTVAVAALPMGLRKPNQQQRTRRQIHNNRIGFFGTIGFK